MILCPREDCPIERFRKVVSEKLNSLKNAEGQSEFIMQCQTCAQRKGWTYSKDGDREIRAVSSEQHAR